MFRLVSRVAWIRPRTEQLSNRTPSHLHIRALSSKLDKPPLLNNPADTKLRKLNGASHAPSSVTIENVKTESDEPSTRQLHELNPLISDKAINTCVKTDDVNPQARVHSNTDEASEPVQHGYSVVFEYPSRSVEEVWNEWKGIGSFSHDNDANFPVGGLEKLEVTTMGVAGFTPNRRSLAGQIQALQWNCEVHQSATLFGEDPE